MPKRLEEIFKVDDIDSLDRGILLKGILNHIKELDNKEFSRAVELLPLEGRLIAMKERCHKAKDNIACMAYDIAIHGDPGSPPGTPKNLGLEGLWHKERNRVAKEILDRMGEL